MNRFDKIREFLSLKVRLIKSFLGMSEKRDFYWVLSGVEEKEVYRRLEELVKERWPKFHEHLEGLEKSRAIYVNQAYGDEKERRMVEEALRELRDKKLKGVKQVYLYAIKMFLEAVGDKHNYDEYDFNKFLEFLSELPVGETIIKDRPSSELDYGNRRRLLIECIMKFYKVNGWPVPRSRLRRLEGQISWSYNEGKSYQRVYKPEEIAEMRRKAMKLLKRFPQTVAMFMLVSDVGMRPIELIHLLEKDLDLERGLLVRKAAKRGDVTDPWRLQPSTIEALKYWLQVKRRRGWKSPFLFVSKKTKTALSRPDVVDAKLKQFVEERLEYDWRGCYAFRRMNLTLIAKAIPPSMSSVKTVMKLMGWRTPKPFLRYIKEPMREPHEKIFKTLHSAKEAR